MRRNFPADLFFVIFCFISVNISASTMLEIRQALFVPSNHTFQDLYGKIEPNYQIEVTIQLPSRFKNLWFFSNVDQIYQSGHLCNECGSSRISVTNLSFGIKSIFNLSSWSQLYFGIGPSPSLMLMQINSPCIAQKECSKFLIGGAFKSGFYFRMKERCILDLFCDYTYLPIKFENCRNLGGLKFGLGLGYKFGK